MAHDYGESCPCVKYHAPKPVELHIHHILPLSWGGPEIPANEIFICPNAHVSVHELLRAWRKYGTEPPWIIRKYYSPFIRDLARKGWLAWYKEQPK